MSILTDTAVEGKLYIDDDEIREAFPWISCEPTFPEHMYSSAEQKIEDDLMEECDRLSRHNTPILEASCKLYDEAEFLWKKIDALKIPDKNVTGFWAMVKDKYRRYVEISKLEFEIERKISEASHHKLI